MLGCGTTNHLQSIQLSKSNTSETPMNGLNVPGISSTLQLYVWENRSNGQAVLPHGEGVAYQIVLDPNNFFDAFGNILPAPPQVLNLSTTGLITAINPAVCTWVDVAGIIPPATTAPPPSSQLSGSYDVTATFGGLTTPPVNILGSLPQGVTPATRTFLTVKAPTTTRMACVARARRLSTFIFDLDHSGDGCEAAVLVSV
jgi:hypothetical protein